MCSGRSLLRSLAVSMDDAAAEMMALRNRRPRSAVFRGLMPEALTGGGQRPRNDRSKSQPQAVRDGAATIVTRRAETRTHAAPVVPRVAGD